MRFLVLLLMTLLLQLCQPAACQAQAVPVPTTVQDFEKTLVQAIAAAERSLATIAVFQSTPEFPLPADTDLFESAMARDNAALVPSRLGGGVVIAFDQMSKTAMVLTNAQLLEIAIRSRPDPDSVKIAVRFATRQTFTGVMHALDPRSDLAVLRVDLSTADVEQPVRAIEFATVEQLKKGSLVLVFGDVWELARTGSAGASFGMISNRGEASFLPHRELGRDQFLNSLNPWLQVDVRMEAVSSSRAVIDLEGHLIGLTTSLGLGGGAEAEEVRVLPGTASIRNIISDLQQGFEVEYGDLHLQAETVSAGELHQMPGMKKRRGAAKVLTTVKNSPADRAGVQPNDIVLQVNNVEIFSVADLIRETGFLKPGQLIDLKVYRPATRSEEVLQIRLGKWGVPNRWKMMATAHRYPDWRGLRLDIPSDGVPAPDVPGELVFPEGVLILEVLPDTPAASAGLKTGEYVAKVGEQPVETPSEFQDALKYWPESVPITLSDGREVIVETK